MEKEDKINKQLFEEIEELRIRLNEAEETLSAIRSGEVDAIVVSGPQGDQVFTLTGAERAYRVLIETMNEGAVSLNQSGIIIYCNHRLSEMIKTPLEKVIGTSMRQFIRASDLPVFDSLIEKGAQENGKGEVAFLKKDGTMLPVLLSITALQRDNANISNIIVTDLTAQKHIEEELRRHRDNLEELVKDRTNELETSNQQLQEEIKERKCAEETLKESEKRLRAVTESAKDAIIMIDHKGDISYWNPAAERIFGYGRKEALGRNVHKLLVPEKYSDAYSKAFPEFARTGRGNAVGKTLELTGLSKTGEEIPIELSLSTILIEGHWHAVAVIRDITERKQTEESLILFRSLIEQSNDGVEVVDPETARFLDANEKACAELGYTREEFLSLNVPDIDPIVDKSVFPKIVAELRQSGSVMLESLHHRKDGTTFPVEVSLKYIRLERDYVLATVRDSTKRKKAEDRIKYLAYYDALTGIPNRNLFLERINQEIARAKDNSSVIAVLVTDINKFKSIYDIYGSEVGDRVLKEVAERLSTAVRKGDTVVHLGNDEFGIACIDITSADDIIMLEKIIKDISYPLKINGDEIILTFSTGISLYPHDGENASELLKSAGLALSIAKKEGRKTYQFYAKDMTVTASEVLLLEKQLITAIKNEEFILHYQPYWDINTKKLVGMEALVRWQSKDMGLVPPGKFIPILEDTGMIIEVGEWILREAIRQVKEWQDKKYPVVPISVNMSLVQFRQKDLTEMVKSIMGECGFYPSLLTLEITESAFMQDIEFTRSVLTAMKEIGCSISIDDFGTGYSSLAYLKRLPIDNLKIDISFIREMVQDPDSASIVMAIINMAHTLSLKTIAEGIETEEQWNFLRLLRCDMGQGFYLSKPLPAEEVIKILI